MGNIKVVKKEPVFVWGHEVELEHVDWLWPNRFPLGMLSIIAGLGGVSKSTLTLYMAAQITTGRPFIDDPPGTTREPGDVVILSAEDSPGNIIMPRLIAMGADTKRICILKAIKVTLEGGQTGITGVTNLSKNEGDLDMLVAVIKQCPNPLLVIIDPYTGFMTGKQADSNDNIAVRSFLRPLGEMAADFHLTVIGITHFNKKEDSSAALRILGSVGQQNAARMCWYVLHDPDAEDRRYLIWAKGNMAARCSGLAYRLVNTPVTFKNRTSFYPSCNFEKEPVHLTADELMAPRPKKSGRPRKQTDAGDWLESFLSDGGVDSKLIFEEGKHLGYSQRTLERAKKSVGILGIPVKNHTAKIVRWEWRLP
ncbi:hypothetical protein LCGC14_0573890 [marine sediment metagenome]|uniref:AAA+ ATPase domain-containing protein n=1 Tax=marine sediment metagenome TaxID=412755 RepID=A0A0F9RND2_9ZZZZ